MQVRLSVCASTLALVGMAYAHTGVQNPAVLARMENMSDIADEMEVLVNMARGATAHDATLAETARARLAEHAGEVVDLFEAPETDPQMEALPVIWEDFADFSAKAADFERAALGLSGRLAS
jgi:cytochrome c556